MFDKCYQYAVDPDQYQKREEYEHLRIVTVIRRNTSELKARGMKCGVKRAWCCIQERIAWPKGETNVMRVKPMKKDATDLHYRFLRGGRRGWCCELKLFGACDGMLGRR